MLNTALLLIVDILQQQPLDRGSVVVITGHSPCLNRGSIPRPDVGKYFLDLGVFFFMLGRFLIDNIKNKMYIL